MADPLTFDEEMWQLRKLVPMTEAQDAAVRVAAVKSAGAAGVQVRFVIRELALKSQVSPVDADALVAMTDEAASAAARQTRRNRWWRRG